jgi:hypothetical protein
MEATPQKGVQSENAAEYIQAARKNLAEVKTLLSRPTTESVQDSGDLMREVEVQLGCAVAILRSSKQRAAATLIAEIQELKHQTEFLALLVAETNRFLSGWVSRVLISRNGYTDRGAAAPLFLVRKTSAEG